MLLAGSIAERNLFQTWLGEHRDCTTRCLVSGHRETQCLADAACKAHCKVRRLANAGQVFVGCGLLGTSRNGASGICGVQQLFGFVLSSRMRAARAQPQANSIVRREHDKQSQRSHQPRNKPRKPPAIAKRSGLRLADAKCRIWQNAARGEHHKTMGLAVLTCRGHAETRCLANVHELQGASLNSMCLRAQPEHNSKPPQPRSAQGFLRLAQAWLSGV